jgi:hypothetical protein
MTVLDRTIYLLTLTPGCGTQTAAETVRRAVCASVSLPSARLTFAAEAAGRRLDLSAVVYTSDWCSGRYTHADVDGTVYRITGTAATDKRLFTRLLCERGL